MLGTFLVVDGGCTLGSNNGNTCPYLKPRHVWKEKRDPLVPRIERCRVTCTERCGAEDDPTTLESCLFGVEPIVEVSAFAQCSRMSVCVRIRFGIDGPTRKALCVMLRKETA